MQLQNFFFDLDGTIINSEPGLLCAHTHCLEQAGYTGGLQMLSQKGVGWTIGPPLSMTVPELIGSVDAAKVQQYIRAFQNSYQQVYYKNFMLYDGIDNLLRTLKEQGKKIFVCTSKPQPIACKLMEHLHYNTLICDLIGAHLDERPHDKSDLLCELCAKHGCAPQHSVIIGDRSYDMSAGQQLGFAKRIGVTYGFGTWEELLASGATDIAHHAREILTKIF